MDSRWIPGKTGDTDSVTMSSLRVYKEHKSTFLRSVDSNSDRGPR